jgi:Fe-S-cluster containining protein
MTRPLFWHELKLGPRITLDFGDIKIVTPDNVIFECSRCGNCCRAISADVKEADIIRLSKKLKRPPSEIATKRPDGRLVLWHEKEYYISPQTLTQSVSRCIFLDGEKNLCTIYEDRPAVCMTFPFHLDSNGVAFFIFEKWPDYSNYCPGFYYGTPNKDRYEDYAEGLRSLQSITPKYLSR